MSMIDDDDLINELLDDVPPPSGDKKKDAKKGAERNSAKKHEGKKETVIHVQPAASSGKEESIELSTPPSDNKIIADNRDSQNSERNFISSRDGRSHEDMASLEEKKAPTHPTSSDNKSIFSPSEEGPTGCCTAFKNHFTTANISNWLTFLTMVAGLVVTNMDSTKGTASDYVLAFGLFGFAGGITNWIAVKMLFDEVPGKFRFIVVYSKMLSSG